MAKNAIRSSGSSKIRFIMLEADLADGDLSQITQAITNALKPAMLQQRVLSGPDRPIHTKATATSAVDDVEIEDAGNGDEELPEPSPAASRAKTPRSYKEPKRLDLDLSRFVPFAKEKDPSEFIDKHLVAAWWFKEHFGTPNIGIDHAYSAYLAAGWSPKMVEFDKPFRILKQKGLVKRVEPGLYTVTFPGVNEVREMGNKADAAA